MKIKLDEQAVQIDKLDVRPVSFPSYSRGSHPVAQLTVFTSLSYRPTGGAPFPPRPPTRLDRVRQGRLHPQNRARPISRPDRSRRVRERARRASAQGSRGRREGVAAEGGRVEAQGGRGEDVRGRGVGQV